MRAVSLSFIQGLTEDYCLGDSSDELLQRGRGGASIYLHFLAGKYRHSSIQLGKRLLLFTKNTYLKLMILVLFYVQEEARIWGH